MVDISSDWREQRSRMAARVAQSSHGKQVPRNAQGEQVPRLSNMVQDATTRTMACPVCKALYTPAPTHQQLVLAPHIVLESAFMSMCHFCFRCRRAACPDCWDAVHGVCGACVAEAMLPFRTQVKPLSNAMPPMPQQQQVAETMHAAPILVCIQHGRFYVEPSQHASPAHPDRMSRPIRIAPSEAAQRSPRQDKPIIRIAPEYPKYAVIREKDKDKAEKRSEQLEQPEQPGQMIGWITDAWGTIEQWLTGALLVLLLTIVTMIVLAEASPSANAQIMHVFQIDIRSEVAYLIHLMGQL